MVSRAFLCSLNHYRLKTDGFVLQAGGSVSKLSVLASVKMNESSPVQNARQQMEQRMSNHVSDLSLLLQRCLKKSGSHDELHRAARHFAQVESRLNSTATSVSRVSQVVHGDQTQFVQLCNNLHCARKALDQLP